MPKIVMINTVCGGSHGGLAADLRQAAEGAGFETVAAFGRGEARDGRCLRVGSQRDVLAHVALTRLLDRHGLGSRRATERLVAALDAMKPDALHLHNIHGYYLHVPTLFHYIRRSKAPTLWTLHDCWALTGHCSHFLRADCDRWKTGCYACPLKGAYPASLGLDASAANYRLKRAAFTGLPNLSLALPSRWLEGVVAESFLGGAPRAVVENGVDLDLFRPVESAREAYGAREGQALLLGVASPFDERKGFSDALAVAKLLGERARLVLVGLTEKQRRGLPENVTGLPPTKGPGDLVPLYSAADCLLNPTREDTYPTVNMEAMASGTPVAAYGVGGCAEQLEPPVGVAVAPGDKAALAEAALALALRKRSLKEACRAYARLHFDRRKAVERYIEKYKQMTGA